MTAVELTDLNLKPSHAAREQSLDLGHQNPSETLLEVRPSESFIMASVVEEGRWPGRWLDFGITGVLREQNAAVNDIRELDARILARSS